MNELKEYKEIELEPKGVTALEIRMNSDRFPRIAAIEKGQCTAALARIITAGFLLLGQNPEPAKVKFMASTLQELFAEEEAWGLKYITVQEVARVVKNAVLTDSTITTLSPAVIYREMVKYAKGEGALLQKKAYEGKRAIDRKKIAEHPVAIMLDTMAAEMARKNNVNTILKNKSK